MTRRRRGVVRLITLAWLLMTAAVSAAPLETPGVALVAPLAGAVRLATTGNGQSVICLDGHRGAIVAVDPFDPERRREVVAPVGADEPRPVAVAVVDTGVVAAVCRQGESWSLCTWRLQPDRPLAAADTLQTIELGTAPAAAESEVDLVVSDGRDWIAVAGLPSPLPPVLRAAVAGVRIGPLTDRSCPTLAAGARPVALAAGPRGELVLIERDAAGRLVLAFHDAGGQGLLRLTTGLTEVRDVAFSPGGEHLWAIGAAADRAGLWRLEATLDEGRQAIRPVLVARLDAARAVTAPTDRAVVVAHGLPEGRVERFDLVRDPGAEPEPETPDAAGRRSTDGDR